MSYRVYVNDVQLFGNNEEYDIWNDFIRSQGIKIGKDGQYDGEIHDFHGAMLACEKIVRNLIDEHRKEADEVLPELKKAVKESPDDAGLWRELMRWSGGYFDFSKYEQHLDKNYLTLFDICYEIVTTGCVFLPFTLYLACRDLLDASEPCKEENGFYRVRNYKFKPGITAHVHAG